jgi:hypothetical protein
MDENSAKVCAFLSRSEDSGVDRRRLSLPMDYNTRVQRIAVKMKTARGIRHLFVKY